MITNIIIIEQIVTKIQKNKKLKKNISRQLIVDHILIKLIHQIIPAFYNVTEAVSLFINEIGKSI